MKEYFYLFHIQYLGFRYHGWMKQPGLATIESMLEKTATYVLETTDFKILGASRTDAMVSANHSAFELFTRQDILPGDLEERFNLNLPNDIRVLKVKRVSKEFNIIQSVKFKEYRYLFSSGKKFHPFAAALSYNCLQDLNIELMMQGASLFRGAHNFRLYCTKPRENAEFDRIITVSEVKGNDWIRADFIPRETYCFRVRSKGFMRNQVRLMMGQLLRLGGNQISLEDIRASLTGERKGPLPFIAPASGLVLNKIEFEI